MRKALGWLGSTGAIALAIMSLAGIPAQARSVSASAMAHSRHSSLPSDMTDPCAPATPGVATCAALTASSAAGAQRGTRTTNYGKITPDTTPAGYGPSDLQSAYGLPSASAGYDQTVAVVSAYDDPSAAADLNDYRTQYGLPTCGTGTSVAGSACFQKFNETGGTTYPSPDAGWSEVDAESLDVASAICPNCHILLIEANTTKVSDLSKADNEAAALGADFINNDWFTPEVSEDTTYDPEFDHPGVAITAPSGNSGYGVNYPASSQYITAVGGTTLTSGGTGIRPWTEVAFSGSGSGCSGYEPKPSWQTDTGCSDRTVSDLAAVADPSTPVAFYESYGLLQGQSPWFTGSGTAAASAIVAAAYALAGTPAANTNPASYPYENPGGSYTTPGHAYPYPAGLNDITSGSTDTCSPSYLCTAGPGYDGPTGLGSPSGTAELNSTGGLTGSVYSGEQDMCMDDSGDATKNGTKIQIYHCLDDASQDWTIESNGTVQLTDDYCLDAENGGPDIQLYQCDGDLNQQWVPQSNGTLENPNAKECLVDPSGSTTNGTQLQLAACSTSAPTDEQWILPYSIPSATGNIQSQLTTANICLDDANGGTGQGNKIQIYQCLTGSSGTDQQWTVEPNGTIQFSGHCMATVKDGTANGTLVALYACTGDTNQRWTQRSNGTLVNTRSGTCLDDPSASTTNGQQLQIWSCDGDAQQNWVLP